MERNDITSLTLSNGGQVPTCCGYVPQGAGAALSRLCPFPLRALSFRALRRSDDCYLALRLESVQAGRATGVYLGYCTNPLTFGLFSSAQWLEEYGLMRALFLDFDSGETQSRRIFLTAPSIRAKGKAASRRRSFFPYLFVGAFSRSLPSIRAKGKRHLAPKQRT